MSEVGARGSLGPDVQCQAVLALCRVGARSKVVNDAVCVVEEAGIVNVWERTVWTIVAKVLGLVALVALVGLGTGETKVTDGRLRVRDAQILNDAGRIVSNVALNQTIGGLDLEELGGGSFALVGSSGGDKTRGKPCCSSDYGLGIHAGRDFS